MWSDYALDGVLEDEIRQLIAGEQGASQGSAICGDDQNFFCTCTIVLVHVLRLGLQGTKVFLTIDIRLERHVPSSEMPQLY